MERMIRLTIIHDIEVETSKGPLRWAYARRSRALEKYAPADFNVMVHSDQSASKNWSAITDWAHIVFVLDYMCIRSYQSHLQAAGFQGPIVGSFNKDSRSREKEFKRAYAASDWLIVNNRERWEYEGKPARTCCIANGIDLDDWGRDQPFTTRPQRAIYSGGTGIKKAKGWHEVLHPLTKELQGIVECDFRPVTDIKPEQVMTTPEMRAWYNSARYVVCTSATEGGGPGIVMEGMACGCVPVCTAAGGIPDYIQSGYNGLICQRDPKSFRSAILWLADNPDAAALISLQATRTMQQYHYKTWADHYYQLFRALANGQHLEPYCTI